MNDTRRQKTNCIYHLIKRDSVHSKMLTTFYKDPLDTQINRMLITSVCKWDAWGKFLPLILQLVRLVKIIDEGNYINKIDSNTSSVTFLSFREPFPTFVSFVVSFHF